MTAISLKDYITTGKEVNSYLTMDNPHLFLSYIFLFLGFLVFPFFWGKTKFFLDGPFYLFPYYFILDKKNLCILSSLADPFVFI